MKTYYLLLVCILTFQVCGAQEKKSINFSSTSWSATLERAKKEQKAVFLYAYTTSCRWCRQMEKEVFTEQEVAAFYNANFVSYKIDIEDGGAGEAIAGKYRIVGFPTYLYFNKEGDMLHQSGSAKSSEEFLQDGKNAFNPEKALFSLQRRYASGNKSPYLLYHYSNALGSYHHVDSPEERIVSEYLQTQSARQLASDKNLRYIFTKHLSFHAPSTQYFLENQGKFIRLFQEDEVKHKAERIITRTAAIAGRENDAALFEKANQAIAAHFADTARLAALARMYFYQGQRAWRKYAKATLAYSRSQGSEDERTLYETAAYLNGFSKERVALETGALVMERVLSLNRSYENLFLYAQLQQKAGREEQALRAAKEAVETAGKTGKDGSGARSLVAALQGRAL